MTAFISGPTTFDQIRWASVAYHREPEGIANLDADDPQWAEAIQAAAPYLNPLSASALEFDDLRCATLDIIESAFNSIASVAQVDPDVVSRILVASNPRLFVVWDPAIRDAYFPNDEPNGATYSQFLSVMRMAALTVISDARASHGIDDPAGSLSGELGLQPGRSLARFIDQYNWLTLSRNATPIATGASA
jgi:hypothetical protein